MDKNGLHLRNGLSNGSLDLAANHMRIAEEECRVGLNVNGDAIPYSRFANCKFLSCEYTRNARGGATDRFDDIGARHAIH